MSPGPDPVRRARRSVPGTGPRPVLVEICCASVEDVVAAEEGGADRVELCAGLVEGGTTPSIGLVGAVLGAVECAGVQVLVRPRGGDFLYSEAEVEVMLADISALRAMATPGGAQLGFVLGALSVDGRIDEDVTGRLVAACSGHPVTFHRAFDFTPDLLASLGVLARLGVRRVLTSGGRQRAVDGSDVLAELVRQAPPGLEILAGGGVRADSVGDLVRRTGVREVHLRAAREVPSAMVYRSADAGLSSPEAPGDYVRYAISAGEVSAVCQALSAFEAG